MSVFLRGTCKRKHRHDGECMTWYYKFMIRRQLYRGAIPEARTKAQAERVETQKREDVYNGRYGLPGEAITFAEFFENTYIPWAKTHNESFASGETRRALILASFGHFKLSEITAPLIEKWKQERLATPAKRGRGPNASFGKRAPGTVNKELALLSKALTLAAKQGILTANPVHSVDKLPLDNQRTRTCSVEEQNRLLDALPETLKAIFWVAINAGCRMAEISNLDWPDVDLSKGLFLIRKSKNKDSRQVPMNADVRAIFAAQYASRTDDGAVFKSRLGRRYKRPNVVFALFAKRLGIENLHWHDLRHTAASRMADTGASPFTIGEILGQRDMRSTKRYTHATDRAKFAAVEAISDYSDCPKIVSIEDYKEGKKTGT